PIVERAHDLLHIGLRQPRVNGCRLDIGMPQMLVWSQEKARSHAPTTAARTATASAHCTGGRKGRRSAGAAARPRAPPSRSPNRWARRSEPGLVPRRASRARLAAPTIHSLRAAGWRPRDTTRVAARIPRSEERRVGKACRAGCAPQAEEKTG